MNKNWNIIVIVLIMLSIKSNIFGADSSKPLILLVDINGTIMAEDTSGGENFDHIVLRSLAGTIHAQWQDDRPSMSYRDMVDQECAQLQGDIETKTKEILYCQILYRVKVAADNELISASEFDKFKKKYDNVMAKKEHHKNVKIFTSFINLIKHLQYNFISFKLIYRTFGNDYPALESEISERLPGFEATIRGEFKADKLFLNGNCYEKFSDALAQIPLNGVAFIQDDYSYWNTNGQRAEFGKPMPFLDFSENIIFFDDNASRKQILKICSDDFKPLASGEIFQQLLERGNIVAVNTYEALIDDDFYINKVHKVLYKQYTNR